MVQGSLAPDNRPVLKVGELNSRVSALLKAEPELQDIWVRGEVSNYSGPYSGSGHCYFRLKDEEASVDVVMWKPSFDRLTFEPEEGLEVLARGEVGLYEVRGSYQFIIREMIPAGEGELALRFQMLKQQLTEEGLFEAARKRALPPFPLHIGLVTSREAAAFRDVLQVLSRRSPHVTVTLAHARVQGDGAAETVAQAIEQLGAYHERTGRLDAIIVTRGGGSIEDLWAFNEEVAVRAVVASRVPVVSGVGHETDTTLVDLAADVRAPTPSAAAEVVAPSREETLTLLEERSRSLAGRMGHLLELKLARLQRVATRPVLTRPEALFAAAWQRTDELSRRLPRALVARLDRARSRVDQAAGPLPRAAAHRLERAQAQLSQQAGRLDALSPLKVLGRGFAAAEVGGRLVRSVSDVARGDRLDIRLVDGRIVTEVQETQREQETQEEEG